MAISINNIQTFGATSGSYTPSSVTDSMLVVFVGCDDFDTDEPITDVSFGGDSLTKCADHDGGSSYGATIRKQIWYLADPGTSSGTITITGGETNQLGFTAVTLGGVAQSSPMDGTDGISTIGAVSVTTTEADTIAISGCYSDYQGGSYSVSGATEDVDTGIQSTARMALGHSIQSSTGTVTHTWSLSPNSGRRGAIMAVFKAASGGSSVSVTPGAISHGHAAEANSFFQVHDFGLSVSLHSQNAENASLAQIHTLGGAAAVHAQNGEQVALSVGGALAPANAAHAHAADLSTVIQIHALALHSALSAHWATLAALITSSQMSISDALHGHGATGVVFGASVIPPSERLILPAAASRLQKPAPDARINQAKR